MLFDAIVFVILDARLLNCWRAIVAVLVYMIARGFYFYLSDLIVGLSFLHFCQPE